MNNTAVIDIGSNSIRYAEERAGRLPVKEIYTTRLGLGLSETGRLAEATMNKSLVVLRALGKRARAAGYSPMAYATSAVRDAENGREFADRIEIECGYPVRILTGEEEARFAFLGAAGFEKAFDTMLDIGGASMQVVTESTGVSFRAGCVRCGDIARKATGAPDCDTAWREQRKAVVSYMDGIVTLPDIRIGRLVGVGGTITTLAALSAGLAEFSVPIVEDEILTRDGVDRLIEMLAAMGEKRREHPLLVKRHDVILYGAYILHHAMELLGAEALSVSCEDGMEGFLRIMNDGR